MKTSTRLLSTIVAELVLTEEAGHVVAALRSLDLSPAHWAENDAVDACAPPLEFPFHCILTARTIPVPVLAAAEADSVGTLRTVKLFSIHTSRDDITIAVGLGTEAGKRVAFQDLALAEIVKFFEHLAVLASENPLQLPRCDGLTAFVLEANYLIQRIVLYVLT